MRELSVATKTEEKLNRLAELARLRQTTRWPGYRGIGDFYDGFYECDHVSPYTITACNVNSPIMVVLQDWASEEGMGDEPDPVVRNQGYSPNGRTNVTLERLLKAHFGLAIRETYATNLFPFVKPGKMNSPIPFEILERAAHVFALPQIKIVEPQLVIILGVASFRAIAFAVGGLIGWPKLADAIENPIQSGDVKLWCQAHTGRSGSTGRAAANWALMAREFGRMAAVEAPRASDPGI